MRVGYVTCAVLPEPDPDAELLLSRSKQHGLEARFIAWDGEPKPLDNVDLLVLRSCWNYHYSPDKFRDWLKSIESIVPVLNPPDLVRWNMDKHYLSDLESSDVPIVPTVFVKDSTNGPIADLCREQGWKRVVVKPTISAGSWKTRVFDHDDPDADDFLNAVTTDRDAMIQPFLPSVSSVGERSVMCIAGEVTHVVVKKPRLDGDEESVALGSAPSEAEKALLSRALSSLPATPLYARLDLIQDERGEWLVSELELIEPSLFFLQWPDAADRFVRAVATTVASLPA